jgi:hypothetical protein
VNAGAPISWREGCGTRLGERGTLRDSQPTSGFFRTWSRRLTHVESFAAWAKESFAQIFAIVRIFFRSSRRLLKSPILSRALGFDLLIVDDLFVPVARLEKLDFNFAFGGHSVLRKRVTAPSIAQNAGSRAGWKDDGAGDKTARLFRVEGEATHSQPE